MTTPVTATPWTVSRLLAWIDQLDAGHGQMSLFDLLEIPPTASMTHVRHGFHAIAITRHPDVWRNRLSPSQLDHLVRVYGRVAAAYATLRDPDDRNRYLRTSRDTQPKIPGPPGSNGRPLRDSSPPLNRPGMANERSALDSQPAISRTSTGERVLRGTPTLSPPIRTGSDSRPPANVPAPAPAPPPPAPTTAAAALGPRAHGYFRRAEAAARIGDIAAAVLNLRLAIAAEPSSTFLRNALAAAQAELRK